MESWGGRRRRRGRSHQRRKERAHPREALCPACDLPNSSDRGADCLFRHVVGSTGPAIHECPTSAVSGRPSSWVEFWGDAARTCFVLGNEWARPEGKARLEGRRDSTHSSADGCPGSPGSPRGQGLRCSIRRHTRKAEGCPEKGPGCSRTESGTQAHL